MNTTVQTTKTSKPVLEYPSIPTNTKVMYLRDKHKTPIGCVVYQEMENDGHILVNYGYSSMARTDLKKEKISPNAKIGRSFAIKHMFDGHSMAITPLDNEVRITRSGQRFLLKETVLRAFLDRKTGSETFRSKIKNHMKYAAQRAAEKAAKEAAEKAAKEAAEKTLEVKIPAAFPAE